MLSGKLRKGGRAVGTWIEGRTHFFVCDVCNDHRITLKEPLNVSFDEWRPMHVASLERAGGL